MRISDWSSDVCSSDLQDRTGAEGEGAAFRQRFASHGNRGPQNCAHDRPHAEASQQQAEDGRSAVERIARKNGRQRPYPAAAKPERAGADQGSEERRGGKECARTCRYRWAPDHSKKKRKINT